MDEFEFSAFDTLGFELHQFETDVRKVVLINHELTLEGIDKAAAIVVNRLGLTDESQRSVATYIKGQYDEYRRAATNLALVGLVSRFHHWLTGLANRIRGTAKETFDKSISKEIGFLNSCLPRSPYTYSNFKKWVDVRDSIIHADAKASWMYSGQPRNIESRFKRSDSIGIDIVKGDELNFTEDDLKEAFGGMFEAVRWYEHQVEEWEKANRGTQILIVGKFRIPQ